MVLAEQTINFPVNAVEDGEDGFTADVVGMAADAWRMFLKDSPTAAKVGRTQMQQETS